MPTLNKLEYLDETKHQIKSALNTKFNSGITDDDTFRSYVTKINNIYTNWPKVTGEGTNITLSNTKKGKMEITPKGNTHQDTLTGKNLLAYTSYGEEKQGVTTTYDSEDGALILNGTANNTFSNLTKESSIDIATGTYTFSIKEAKNYNIRLAITCTDNTTINSTINKGSTSETVNINKATLNQRIFIYENNTLSGTTFTNEKIYVQLESGSTATTFEPYVGGIPSPNPDYPQNVKVVTGNNTITISDGTNSENYSINLGSIELCKIGDYQDYIYKDNGKWYKYGAIRKYTTGVSAVILSNGTYRVKLRDISNLHDITSSTNAYVPSLSKNAIIRNQVGYSAPRYNSGWSGLAIAYSVEVSSQIGEFETSEQLLNWFNNNEEVYIAINPTYDYIDITEITDTDLIGQLEQVFMSYDNPTNITSTYATGNSQIIISASALKKGGN